MTQGILTKETVVEILRALKGGLWLITKDDEERLDAYVSWLATPSAPTIMEDHFGHRLRGKDLKEVSLSGRPSAAAMREWFFGKTRRPQSPTIEAAGRAIGYKRVWKKLNGKEE